MYLHSIASGDTLHERIGLPVDVFHWKTKHKQSNDACAIHCNPYSYLDLHKEDDSGWVFNSSIAEQTNVWLGGYHAILWEMHVVLYDFFLDEIIMEKNMITVAKLRSQGLCPGYCDITMPTV